MAIFTCVATNEMSAAPAWRGFTAADRAQPEIAAGLVEQRQQPPVAVGHRHRRIAGLERELARWCAAARRAHDLPHARRACARAAPARSVRRSPATIAACGDHVGLAERACPAPARGRARPTVPPTHHPGVERHVRLDPAQLAAEARRGCAPPRRWRPPPISGSGSATSAPASPVTRSRHSLDAAPRDHRVVDGSPSPSSKPMAISAPSRGRRSAPRARPQAARRSPPRPRSRYDAHVACGRARRLAAARVRASSMTTLPPFMSVVPGPRARVPLEALEALEGAVLLEHGVEVADEQDAQRGRVPRPLRDQMAGAAERGALHPARAEARAPSSSARKTSPDRAHAREVHGAAVDVHDASPAAPPTPRGGRPRRARSSARSRTAARRSPCRVERGTSRSAP